MESRSLEYYDNEYNEESPVGSRAARNADLYREIRESDVSGYNVKSNVIEQRLSFS